MQNDVIMAGFGGQGILLIGKMLAYAGMREGKEVSWLPSYGPEMRGGTCNCTVVISDRPVGSPVIQSPRAVLAMNLPSLDKFEPNMRAGGVLLINTSLINREAARDDVNVVAVPANQVANELGNPRGANMVALGAYIGATGAVTLEEVEKVIRETFASKPKVIDVNIEALHKGFAIGQEQAKKAGEPQ
jgi:2-oxoglutarate ferredoxin oxidoreductase subunit gamma